VKQPTSEPEARARMPGRLEGLAGEHALTDVGQLVLVALFLAVWIADSFVLRRSVVPCAGVPAFVRWAVGIAVAIAGAVLALAAHRRVFGGARRPPGVIADGVYALVRHPMYLGTWLFFLGLTLATLSLASAGVLLLMLVFYLFVSRHEEKLLLARFGPRYRAYQAATPMFFPVRVRSRHHDRTAS
jgi:protein-S-isoprenylcysteine O-methyltransferase Ste14